jgi:hypothetical protein
MVSIWVSCSLTEMDVWPEREGDREVYMAEADWDINIVSMASSAFLFASSFLSSFFFDLYLGVNRQCYGIVWGAKKG